MVRRSVLSPNGRDSASYSAAIPDKRARVVLNNVASSAYKKPQVTLSLYNLRNYTWVHTEKSEVSRKV